MAGAPIKFRDWATGPETVIVDPGIGDDSDLLALVPIAEPLSAGYPPIAPDLILKMGGIEVEDAVASCRVGSGQRRTYVRQTASRASKWMVRWKCHTQAERDELQAWMATELNWTRLGMSVDVDGEGDTASTLTLRMLDVPTQTLEGPEGRGSTGGGTAWPCIWTIEVECEELF